MDARDAILRAVLQINAAELGEEDVPTDSPLALFFERASRDSLRKSLPGVDDRLASYAKSTAWKPLQPPTARSGSTRFPAPS
jgi:hypothetical protein